GAVGGSDLGAAVLVLARAPLRAASGLLAHATDRVGVGAVALYLESAGLHFRAGALGLSDPAAGRAVFPGLLPAAGVYGGGVCVFADGGDQSGPADRQPVCVPALSPLLLWRLLRPDVRNDRHSPVVRQRSHSHLVRPDLRAPALARGADAS